MFLAGVVPGLLMGLGMMVIVYVIARRRGYDPATTRAGLGEIWRAFVEATWALVMPAIILGGTLGGVFTTTESAAVAVAYAVIVGVFITRELRWEHLLQALQRCVLISAVVFFLVATSEVVTWLLSATGLPVALAETLKSISADPRVFLLLVNVFLLVAGTILEPVPLIIMVAPILAPIAASYGIDPLHFGFVFVLNVVIGLLTPPVGGILFTVCGIAKAPIERVSAEAMPFLLWLGGVLLLVTYVPWIAIGLPQAFGFGR
jgi:C4-dicarboxylate transporter, DctM subunit